MSYGVALDEEGSGNGLPLREKLEVSSKARVVVKHRWYLREGEDNVGHFCRLPNIPFFGRPDRGLADEWIA